MMPTSTKLQVEGVVTMTRTISHLRRAGERPRTELRASLHERPRGAYPANIPLDNGPSANEKNVVSKTLRSSSSPWKLTLQIF